MMACHRFGAVNCSVTSSSRTLPPRSTPASTSAGAGVVWRWLSRIWTGTCNAADSRWASRSDASVSRCSSSQLAARPSSNNTRRYGRSFRTQISTAGRRLAYREASSCCFRSSTSRRSSRSGTLTDVIAKSVEGNSVRGPAIRFSQTASANVRRQYVESKRPQITRDRRCPSKLNWTSTDKPTMPPHNGGFRRYPEDRPGLCAAN